MNVQIKWKGTDITNQVISYTRSQHICTGVGTCVIEFSGNSTIVVNPFDLITVYEESRLMGSYYVSEVTKAYNGWARTINCQDETKKIADYFISDSYLLGDDPTEYPVTCRYWIAKFLTEATVNFQFDVDDDGGTLSNNTSLGLGNCSDIVVPLLQQSGWYYYADENNLIHIGKLEIDPTETQQTLGETEIQSITVNESDDNMRNRAVVWGSGSDAGWVFTDQRVRTAYDRDENDWRTVVLSNGGIAEEESAISMATAILNETSKILPTKTIGLIGFYDLKIGQTVFANSRAFTGFGLVTSLQVAVSSNGAITTVILDERCPRIFGYFDYGGYVYVGTHGSGVWRKPLRYNHTWSDFSDGLENLNVVDLSINNGVFGCVTEDGTLYIRTVLSTQWEKINPGSFVDTGTGRTLDAKCQACVVDQKSNMIEAVYSYVDPSIIFSGDLGSFVVPSGVSPASWLVGYTGLNQTYKQQVTISGAYNFYAYDVDTNQKDTFITALRPRFQPDVPENPVYMFTTDYGEWDALNHGLNMYANWNNPPHNYTDGFYGPGFVAQNLPGYWGSITVFTPPGYGTMEVHCTWHNPITMADQEDVYYLGDGRTYRGMALSNLADCKIYIGDGVFSQDYKMINQNANRPDHEYGAIIPDTSGVGYGNKLLRYNGSFGRVSNLPGTGRPSLDISKPAPVIAYGDGWVYASMTANDNSFQSLNLMEYTEITTAPGVYGRAKEVTFNPTGLNRNQNILDVRSANLTTLSGFSDCTFVLQNYIKDGNSFIRFIDYNYLLNGIVTWYNGVYTLSTDMGVVAGVDSSLQGLSAGANLTLQSAMLALQFSDFTSFSGLANHFETSNSDVIPWMFTSISGLPPTFYQKDKVTTKGLWTTDFVDRTNNLPNSEITCIRLDDRL
jgi:hypothetical protein